jgi:hypothetical protein
MSDGKEHFFIHPFHFALVLLAHTASPGRFRIEATEK